MIQKCQQKKQVAESGAKKQKQVEKNVAKQRREKL